MLSGICVCNINLLFGQSFLVKVANLSIKSSYVVRMFYLQFNHWFVVSVHPSSDG